MAWNWHRNKENKATIFVFGIFWIDIGIHTISEPVFYFRGAYVNFTGYNVAVGYALIIIDIGFIAGSFKRTRLK